MGKQSKTPRINFQNTELYFGSHMFSVSSSDRTVKVLHFAAGMLKCPAQNLEEKKSSSVKIPV